MFSYLELNCYLSEVQIVINEFIIIYSQQDLRNFKK